MATSPTCTVEVEQGDDGSAVAVVDGREASGGWDRVESTLGLFAAEHLVTRVAVHAGVVEWRGRALVMPGPSHAGKSTLTLALAEMGAGVLSDEYAIVDPATGWVSAWPRAVRRRRADGGLDRVPTPEPPRTPVPVGLVAFVRHRPAEAGELRPITAAEAVLGLLDNTVSAQLRPETALTAALAVARAAPAVTGERGEADAAAGELLALLDRLSG